MNRLPRKEQNTRQDNKELHILRTKFNMPLDFTKKYGNDVYTIFSKTVDKFYSNQDINMMRMTFNEAVEKFDRDCRLDKQEDIIWE